MSEAELPSETGTLQAAGMPTRELSHCTDLDETRTAGLPKLTEQVVRPAYLAHIVLQTNRIEEMRNWWRTVLGGAPMFSSKEMEFISFDDEHHRVAILKREEVREKPVEIDTAGLHHVAFTYAGLGDLVATYKRLKDLGILPFRMIHHGLTLSNYYLDPDNNRVELQVNALPNDAALEQWLSERHFNTNPIGVLVDFEEVVSRYEAGEDPWRIVAPAGR